MTELLYIDLFCGAGGTFAGTQAEQKKYIGNAVEVNTSRVLCEALAAKLNQLNSYNYDLQN